MGRPSVVGMKEQRTTGHLRVVGATTSPASTGRESAGSDRTAYWARVQALRAERQRLRAG